MSSKAPNDDDDDKISLTSTVKSEQLDEYQVEKIIGQITSDEGEHLYLVKWVGYPIEECSFEPEQNFCDPETLKIWSETKAAIARGDEAPFDVQAWMRRVEEIKNATERRKRQRRLLRLRAGKAPSRNSPQQEDDSDESTLHQDESEQEIEVLDIEPISDRPKKKLKYGPAKQQSSKPVTTQSTSLAKKNPHTTQSSTTNSRNQAQKMPSRPQFPVYTAQLTRKSWVSTPSRKPKQVTNDNGEFVGFRSLAVQHRYNNYLRRDRTPDAAQLDLRAPGDWLSAPASNVADSESSRKRTRDESESLFVEQGSTNNSPMHLRDNGITMNNDIRRPEPSPPGLLTDTMTINNNPHQSTTPRVESEAARAQPKPTPAKPTKPYDQPPTAPSAESETTEAQLKPVPTKFPTRPPPTAPRAEIEMAANLSPKPPNPPTAPAALRRRHTDLPTLQQPTNLSIRSHTTDEIDAVGLPHNYAGGSSPISNDRRHQFRSSQAKKNDVVVQLKFGPEKKEVGDVRFIYLNARTRRILRDLSVRNVISLAFQEICATEQLQDATKGSRHTTYGFGCVMGYDETEATLDKIAQYLLTHNSVALWHYQDKGMRGTIVLYPSAPQLKFLDGRFPYPWNVKLKLNVNSGVWLPQRPSPLLLSPFSAGPTSPAKTFPNPAQPAKTNATQGVQLPTVMPDPNIIALFRDRYGIKSEDLALVNSSGTQKAPPAVYIHFPKENNQEFQLLKPFLQAHNAIIFENKVDGDYEKFFATSNRIILFHQSFMFYDSLPGLQKLLRHPSNVFSMSLVDSIPDSPTPHFQRLFPHGKVILMTEDFLLYNTKSALKLLDWFTIQLKTRLGGTCKLFFPPNIRQLLSDRIQQWPDETREGSPESLDGETDDEGQHHPIISTSYLPDYGKRAENDHPMIPRGLTQEERNTDHLIEYFAGWGILNCNKYRHFLALTYFRPQPRWKGFNHIDVMNYDQFVIKFMDLGGKNSNKKAKISKERS
ncbi:hypothetical protein FQN57_003333 [Myotisia sp. PD_48]|nr:hypothetical protein FQN57_003333 [Myotisia sp. PD_48]